MKIQCNTITLCIHIQATTFFLEMYFIIVLSILYFSSIVLNCMMSALYTYVCYLLTEIHIIQVHIILNIPSHVFLFFLFRTHSTLSRNLANVIRDSLIRIGNYANGSHVNGDSTVIWASQ